MPDVWDRLEKILDSLKYGYTNPEDYQEILIKIIEAILILHKKEKKNDKTKKKR